MIHKKDIIIVEERVFRQNAYWLVGVVRVLSDCREKEQIQRKNVTIRRSFVINKSFLSQCDS